MPEPDWKAIAADNGFDACGVCDFAPLRGRLLPCRAAARLPDNAARVLAVLFPYRFPEGDEPRNLSRYACVEDYHEAGGRALRTLAGALAAAWPGRAFEPFLDNSPLPEVETAARCGLGVIGDNGLLIHPVYGSWVFIGTVVTDAPLESTERPPAFCPHCGACARACPGGCLPGKGRDTCLSAITQKKGELTPQEQALVRAGGLAWGCDACQEACPLNQGAAVRPHPCFTDFRPLMTEADLKAIAGSGSKSTRGGSAVGRRAYAWRGAAVPRRNLALLKETDKK